MLPVPLHPFDKTAHPLQCGVFVPMPIETILSTDERGKSGGCTESFYCATPYICLSVLLLLSSSSSSLLGIDLISTVPVVEICYAK